MENEEIERQLVELIATDRIDIPISSMSGKLKRKKPKLAKSIYLEKAYSGERVFARMDEEDSSKARGMKEGVALFKEQYPGYGEKLQMLIDEQRKYRDISLVYGMQPGKLIPAQDYLAVMKSLGFSPATAEGLYPELIDISRKLSKKREEAERSILIRQVI